MLCPTVPHIPECLAHPLTALAHPSWPRVPTWRHRSFQRPFLKAMWINFCQVCLLSHCSVLHCVSTVLMDPHATPQGISTCPHLQALQATSLCGVYFLQLWAEPTQINRPIYCECRQHTPAGHGAREESLDQFYLDIKISLCCFWEGRDSFQQEKLHIFEHWWAFVSLLQLWSWAWRFKSQLLWSGEVFPFSLFIHQLLFTVHSAGQAKKLTEKERGGVRPVIITSYFLYLDPIVWGYEHLPAG